MPSASFLLAHARVVPSITVHQEVITIFLSPVLPLPFPCHVLCGTQLCVTTQVPHFQHFWVFLKLINESMNQQMSFFWVHFSPRWNRIYFFQIYYPLRKFLRMYYLFLTFLPTSLHSQLEADVGVCCVCGHCPSTLTVSHPILSISHHCSWFTSISLEWKWVTLCYFPSTAWGLVHTKHSVHSFTSLLAFCINMPCARC